MFKFLNDPKQTYNLSLFFSTTALLFVQLSFDQTIMGIYFSSDGLNVASVCKELIDTGNVSGWHFSEAPYFFPDIIFYLILMLLTSGNFLLSSLLYSLIQFVVISLLFRSLLVFIVDNLAYPVLSIMQVIFSLAIFSVLTGFNSWFVTLMTMLSGYHLGAGLIALAALNLTIRFLNTGSRKYLIVLAVINILVITSDFLYLLYYILPSFLLFIFIQYKIIRRRIMILIIVNSISLFLGVGLNKWMFSTGIIHAREWVLFDTSNVLSSFQQTGYIFHGLLFTGGTRAVFTWGIMIGFVFALVGFFFLLYRYNKDRQPLHLNLVVLCLFIVSSTVASVLAPALKGFVFDSSAIRYYMYPFLLSASGFLIPYFLLTKISGIWKPSFFRLTQLACVLLITGVISVAVDYELWKNYDRFFKYKPEKAEIVDRYARQYGFSRGIAGYWDAKVITMFSDEGVRVVSVYDQLTPYPHAASERYYYITDQDDNIFKFIYTETIDQQYIPQVFNEFEISRVDGVPLVLIPPSIYLRVANSLPTPIDQERK